jgi:hypothetical protein
MPISEYLLAPEKLSSLSAEKRLQLLRNHLKRLQDWLLDCASAPPPTSDRAPILQYSTLRDRLHCIIAGPMQESTLQDRNAIQSVTDCNLSPSVPNCHVRSCGNANRPLETKVSKLLDASPKSSAPLLEPAPDPDPTIPPPPPCTFGLQDEFVLTSVPTAWNYVVLAHKNPHRRIR